MSKLPRARRGRAAFAVCSLFLAATAAAQCGPSWQPGAPAPGPAGSVYAADYLPNGDLVVGGEFRIADDVFANRVARWDGSRWRALGAGVTATVRAVAGLPNGDVVVGGDFAEAGGVPANSIARWNGTAWSPLGTGLGGRVEALLALPGGDLIAGGTFQTVGGSPAPRIARWDGVAWSPLGSGLGGPVYCLAALPNGDVLAGGQFATAGGVPAIGVARWDGATWSALPGLGLTNPSYVFDLQVLPGGAVALAGLLSIGAASAQIAIWNGTTLQPLSPPPGLYNEVGVAANGDLIAGGYSVGASTGTVARYDGTSWTGFGDGAPFRTFALLTAANGDLIAAGTRLDGEITTGNAVARFDGTAWHSVGAPAPPRIDALVAMPNGDVVAGGRFASIAGIAAANVARWDGSAWAPLGLGLDGAVTALAVTGGGTLWVSGEFANAGGGPANRIARWNGTSWSSVGAGLPAAANALAADDAGGALALLGAVLQHFDGAAWQPLAVPYSGTTLAIAADPAGGFVLGGIYAAPPGLTGSVRFAGGSFSVLNGAPIATGTFGRAADGSLLAAGPPPAAAVLRLAGSAWQPLGSGTFPFLAVHAFAARPDGGLLAVSRPVSSTQAVLAQFDGTTWRELEVLDVQWAGSMQVRAASSADGDLLLAGDLAAIDGAVHAGLAIAFPGCPAAAVPFGTGCTGAAGPLTLLAGNLPWTGATFRSTATGLAPLALALHAIGVTPTVLPLPLGAPGCSLFVAPLLVDLLFPAAGQVDAAFAVPADPSLAGVALRTQVVSLELDATLALVRTASTNALLLTVGSL